MGYVARCPEMSWDDGQKLGCFLRDYAIALAHLDVCQVYESGKRVKETPLASAIMDTAGSLAGAAGGASAAAPVAIGCAPLLAPLVALLAPVIMPLGLASLVAMPFVSYNARRTLATLRGKDPIAYTELAFRLADVGPRRVLWCEYLLSIHGARHDWLELQGMRYPRQWEVGASYAARNAGYPPAWGGDGNTKARSERRTRSTKDSHDGKWLSEWLG